MELVSTFFMAVLPVSKVFITCALGAYLGHPRVNVLTADARKLLNRLVFIVFTPALVFSQLAKTVSYENILKWWYMPFNILLCFAFGTAMGMLVVKYTSVPPHLKNLALACCAAGNTGNLLLVLVPAICQEDGSPFGRSEVCSRTAVAYVSYGLWMGILMTWTFIYKLLQPPEFGEVDSAPARTIGSRAGSPESTDFGDFQSGGCRDDMEDFDPQNNEIKTVPNSVDAGRDMFTPSLPPSSYQVPTDIPPRSLMSGFVPARPITQDPKAYFLFIVRKYDLKAIFNPPTSAALIGLLVGGITPVKSLFDGPFLVFVDSAEIIGQAMIPSMNLVLGASLVQGGGESELALPSIFGIIFVRLVALPIIGMILIKIVNDLSLLPPGDALFQFVLMLQFTMPTGINIGTLSQLFSVGEKDAALVLFYSYLSAALLITFWVIIYLRYIFV